MYMLCTSMQSRSDPLRKSRCSLVGHFTPVDGSVPNKKAPISEVGHFGQRLADLRQQAGLSQLQLARATGISRRMIAHYESREAMPLGHVLSSLADGFGITVDELVGKRPIKSSSKTDSSRRILRRLQQMEKLPMREKREVLSIIDTYLERNRLLQRTG